MGGFISCHSCCIKSDCGLAAGRVSGGGEEIVLV